MAKPVAAGGEEGFGEEDEVQCDRGAWGEWKGRARC